MMRPLAILVCLTALAFCNQAFADEFPALANSEADRSAEPMAAEAAAKAMKLPAGFRATVFASEPDVQNPIAMTWDSRGRLWVAENFTYAENKQRFDLSFRDRVLVFEDTNHDGVADSRVVFTDRVQMLTSVEVGHGGVWLMCPPQVLFIPDANADLVPDGPAQVVLDGFEVAQANYHNYANGLRFGPDGWLYGRCGGSCPGRIGAPGTPTEQRFALEGGMWRYHPVRRSVEVLTAGTTNPWGHDWNEFGELFFVNTVNGHFWHGIPGAHFNRPFNLDPNPRTYETIDTHADHYHFDTGKSWTASRDGAANSLGGGHAHCGAMFYSGNQWPKEYHGQFLTMNFHGRRLNQEAVVRRGSGYVASHRPDFALMADPFFRGMDLSVGPDGTVTMIDWSDTGECHESTGVHRTSGRIYQIAYGDERLALPVKDIASLTAGELIAIHEGGDEWSVRQARLALHQRVADGDSLDQEFAVLKQFVASNDPLTAVRAAMTLVACGRADNETAMSWLTLRHEHLRAWGVRALVDSFPIDDVYGPRATVKQVDESLLETFVKQAQTDESALVRLQLASALQRMPVDKRARLATALMTRAEDANDHNLPLLVWYGLMPVAESDPSSLVDVAMTSLWPKTQLLIARRLAEDMHQQMQPMNELLLEASKADDSVKSNIARGIADAMKGWAKAPEPANWRAFSASVDQANEPLTALVRELGVVFGDGRAMSEIRTLVLDEKAEIGVRRSALISLVNQKPDDLKDICVKLLGDQRLSAIAAKGLAADENADNAKLLIKNFGRFRGTDRAGIIATLVSRKTFASELVDAIGRGEISRSMLSAYDARQIRSFGDEALNSRLADAWGETRESPQERKDKMVALKEQLAKSNDLPTDLGKGRVIFQELCGKCHRMYGEGQKIGPDLTGSNRDNLDYLIENIIDPSAVISKEFRMSVLSLADGRVLNGVIVSKNNRTTTLLMQTETVTIENEEIEEVKLTSQSPMPDGQLDALSEAQVRDLFGYLRHPVQVPLP
jgi:putative membrane-bound dehydrogenase-like protein